MRFRIRIQRLSKALLVPFAIVIATGFGSAPVHAGDKIRCIFPFWFGFAPVFVAQEEGYFASEDLEVTTSFDNDRANVLPAMSTGAIECTMRTIGESMSRPRRADTTGTIIVDKNFNQRVWWGDTDWNAEMVLEDILYLLEE